MLVGEQMNRKVFHWYVYWLGDNDSVNSYRRGKLGINKDNATTQFQAGMFYDRFGCNEKYHREYAPLAMLPPIKLTDYMMEKQ